MPNELVLGQTTPLIVPLALLSLLLILSHCLPVKVLELWRAVCGDQVSRCKSVDQGWHFGRLQLRPYHMRDRRKRVIGLSARMFKRLSEVLLPVLLDTHQCLLLDSDALEEVDLVLVAFHFEALSSGDDLLKHDALLLFLLKRLNLLPVLPSQFLVHFLRRL